MPTRLDEVLQGHAPNYILPLVWQCGEPEPVIRAELARIHESGIGAVCVEARPHPDFVGPLWWRDLDVIMDEARRRGLRVWIFDDDHFPTGHAAGRAAAAPPELRRMFLKERHVDAVGPQPGAAFPLAPWRMRLVPPLGLAPIAASLVAAVAARRDPAGALARLAGHAGVRVAPLAELAGLLHKLGCYELTAEGEQPYLRHYHVAYPELEVFLLCNEHPLREVDTSVALPTRGPLLAYDAFANQVARLDCVAEGAGTRLALRLSPYESLVAVAGPGAQALAEDAPAAAQPGARAQAIAGPWALARASAEQHPAFELMGELHELRDMSAPDALPAFAGTLHYEARFAWAQAGAAATLDLGAAYEVAEVFVNGLPAGLRICPPYRFELGALLRPGANTLVIEVTNTLGTEQRDFFSRFAQHEPSGLLGPVRIVY